MASTKSCKGRLTKQDLAVVLNYLVVIKKKWFDIGVQLDLDPEELDKLLLNEKFTNNDRLRKAMMIWLLGDTPVPTWRSLCTALRTPCVNETRVASIIERERIFVDLELSGVSPESVLSEALSIKNNISLSEKETSQVDEVVQTGSVVSATEETPVQKPAAMETNTLLSHSDEDHTDFSSSYVEPVVVRDPFPYLTTSGLSAEEKDTLLERLVLEASDMRLKFCSLTSNFHESLLTRNVPLNKLNEEVKSFHPYYYERIYKYRATDVTTALGLLNNNWNFHFYDVLKHLISKLGSAEDQTALQGYVSSHTEFCKRRLFECPDGVFGGSRWEHEDELVVKKSNKTKSINDITLADVSTFVGEFRKEIKADEFSMRLLSVAVEDSHSVFYFAMDTSLVNSDVAFPLSQECKEGLMAAEVWHVSCGEFIFQHKPLDEYDGGIDEEEEEGGVESSLAVSVDAGQTNGAKDLTLGLRECMSYEDEDIGNYTDLASNNIKQVVEVSNSLVTPSATPYKSYKIGRYRRGTLEWVSGMKGIRYGIGRYPKVTLNDEGYVVEVDEEEEGKISFRVGIIHPSNVMLWTEATPMAITGSQPCVAICWKTVVIAYTKNGDAYYSIGELDTGQRTIQWTGGEHKFLTGGVRGIALSVSANLEVGVVYSKSAMSSIHNPLYFIAGKLSKEKISFASDKGSTQNFATSGWYPSISMKSNKNILVVYSQTKSVPYKKIKYCIGRLEKSTKGSGFKVNWEASPEDCFDFASERASMVVNEKGVVIISHAQNQKYTCHVGKLFQETII